MKIRRIYLDTSVIGGCFDVEFREESLKLFECIRVGIYKGLISSTTFGELKGAPAPVCGVLEEFDEDQIEELEDSPLVPKLARAYIAGLALPPSCEDDATHIAFANAKNFKRIIKAKSLSEQEFRILIHV